jgi:hypothetical protein
VSDNSKTTDRPTRTVRFPRSEVPYIEVPHPEFPGMKTQQALSPGMQFGSDFTGRPYVVSDIRVTDSGVEVDLVAVVES